VPPPWSSPASFVDVVVDEVVDEVEVEVVVVVGLLVVDVPCEDDGALVSVTVVPSPPPHAAIPVPAPAPRAIDIAIVASRFIALLSSLSKRGRVARTRAETAAGWVPLIVTRLPPASPLR
jgi:hypothetical protein